jgi:hypothetical protein
MWWRSLEAVYAQNIGNEVGFGLSAGFRGIRSALPTGLSTEAGETPSMVMLSPNC